MRKPHTKTPRKDELLTFDTSAPKTTPKNNYGELGTDGTIRTAYLTGGHVFFDEKEAKTALKANSRDDDDDDDFDEIKIIAAAGRWWHLRDDKPVNFVKDARSAKLLGAVKHLSALEKIALAELLLKETH